MLYHSEKSKAVAMKRRENGTRIKDKIKILKWEVFFEDSG